jgi:hypothetical protein
MDLSVKVCPVQTARIVYRIKKVNCVDVGWDAEHKEDEIL